MVTKKVNGGLNGLADRREYYRRAKVALSRRQGLFVVNDQGTGAPIIQRGSFGYAVTLLQEKLRAKGFSVTIDADFGLATDLAVRQFQAQQGLTVDGVVGSQTWEKLG
ncbi:peptidoglycan-binding protein [Rhodovulum sulfidophilum]|uniref:peptidoglycan-binding protein n=1 Tax=Rhodovulum sulfidophilum TaxID=35806 RepID=UPI0019213AE4|nr:peptidoglycan-binding protein [Rhodovulum sulfidophilum]